MRDAFDTKSLFAELGIADVNSGGFDGEWLGSGPPLEVITPCDGSRLATVTQVTESEYERIAARAHAAFLAWRTVPAPKRGEVIRQLGNHLREKMPPVRLAAAMTIAARVALAPALLALGLAPAPALAVPFAIQLGPERVVLETPPGFSDVLPHASPRLNELAERLTSPSNRILAFGVSDGDMRAFSTGERLSLRRYMLIATPKGLERESVAPEDFTRIVNDSLRELGKGPESADYIKFLDDQPVGRTYLLKELRREPAFSSVLQGAKLPPDPRIARWRRRRTPGRRPSAAAAGGGPPRAGYVPAEPGSWPGSAHVRRQ